MRCISATTAITSLNSAVVGPLSGHPWREFPPKAQFSIVARSGSRAAPARETRDRTPSFSRHAAFTISAAIGAEKSLSKVSAWFDLGEVIVRALGRVQSLQRRGIPRSLSISNIP